jgi:hypothetical protein
LRYRVIKLTNYELQTTYMTKVIPLFFSKVVVKMGSYVQTGQPI